MERYVWRSEWVQQFESPWSIVEKLCYTNVILKRGSLLKRFGKEHIKTLKGPVKIGKYVNLFTMDDFEEVSLTNFFGFNLLKQNSENINKMINNVSMISTELTDWFNRNLVWCEECIKEGYHSILHQFKLLKHCPIHMKGLIQSCSNCKSEIPYEFSDIALSAAFTCKCGVQLADLKKRWNNWGKQFEIKCEFTKKWLETNYNTEKLSILFLPEHAVAQNNPIKTILEMLENPDIHTDYDGNVKSTLNKLRLPVTISNNNNQKYLHNHIIDNNFTLSSMRSVNMPLYNYLYSQSIYIFKSIESHLFNGELKKHKSCIKRLQELRREEKEDYPEICPFAYTYIFWKHSFKGGGSFYSNHFSIDPRKSIHGFEVLSGFFQPDVEQLVKILLQYTNQHKSLDIGLFKWIIMKFVSALYLHFFNYWSKLAVEGAANKWTPKYNELNNNRHKEIPLMIFKVRNSFKETTSFIIEKNSIDNLNKLTCPCNSNNKRRIKPSEISHHPMALAIDKNSSYLSLTERYIKNLDIFRLRS